MRLGNSRSNPSDLECPLGLWRRHMLWSLSLLRCVQDRGHLPFAVRKHMAFVRARLTCQKGYRRGTPPLAEP